MTDGPEDEFSQKLVSDLVARAATLDQYVSQLSTDQSYPSAARDVLVAFLRELNRAIVRRLEELSRTRVRRFSSLENAAKRLGVVLALLFELLEVVVQSDSHRIPTPLVPPLEALIRRFFNGALLLLTYDWEYNFHYENLGVFLSRWPDYAGLTLETAMPEHFVIFGFPATEHENVLRHAAFAHEIGHFVASAQGLENQLPATFDLRLISAIEPEDHPRLFPSVKSWYGELFADVLGISLFGPAYFFAFAEIGLEGMNAATLEHPQPSFRLKWMLSLLKKLGYLDVLDADGRVTTRGVLEGRLKEVFGRWEDFLERNAEDPGDPFFACLASAAREALGSIEETARRTIGAHAYTPLQFEQNVGPLVDQLLRLVPPADVHGQPPDAISIMNAGWVVETIRRPELETLLSANTPEEKAAIREVINRLLYKAIEYSVITRLWNRL